MNLDIGQSTTSNLTGTVSSYSVSSMTPDQVNGWGKVWWNFPDSDKNLGYYLKIPELKKAVDSFATWTVGKGYKCPLSSDEVILDSITGNGKDNFVSIMWQMIVGKKIFGDAFGETIRNDGGIFINLKPLYAGDISVFYTAEGLIDYYEQRQVKGEPKRIKPENMFHLQNDRIVNQIHGTSVIDACKWVIDARNEAMADWRRISHRATIRVMFIDISNTAKLASVKAQYQDAINKGELMILPAKPGEAEMKDMVLPPIDAFIRWIQYLENFFYIAVGVPPTILGGSHDASEANSKIAMQTFEQPHMSERKLLEQEIWNQLAVRIDFDEPASLLANLEASEAANTGQVGFQPKDMMITGGRE